MCLHSNSTSPVKDSTPLSNPLQCYCPQQGPIIISYLHLSITSELHPRLSLLPLLSLCVPYSSRVLEILRSYPLSGKAIYPVASLAVGIATILFFLGLTHHRDPSPTPFNMSHVVSLPLKLPPPPQALHFPVPSAKITVPQSLWTNCFSSLRLPQIKGFCLVF